MVFYLFVQFSKRKYKQYQLFVILTRKEVLDLVEKLKNALNSEESGVPLKEVLEVVDSNNGLY